MLGSDAQQPLCVLVLTMGVLSTALLLRRRAWRKGLEVKVARARGLLEQQLCQAKSAVETFWQKHPNLRAESVVSLSLLELRQKLQEGVLSPELVVYSYMEQVLRAQKELNCLTGLVPDWEQQLQELQQRPHRGPLHGIPISLKDSYQCQGQVSSCGTFALLDSPAMEDSVIVKVLKSQGAVVFAKTNIPQAMLSYNSDNPIFGNTLNPHNPKRSPGGSSSGEAALIATGGSILGMGTDLGGSIRLPASFCGICGFKTTSARLSLKGVTTILSGLKMVSTSLGPMARDVDSLVLCMRALLCDELFRLDPIVPPLPFNNQLYSCSKPLRIGYYESNGFFEPLPCMKRAVQQSRELLERAGHQLIPFPVLQIEYMTFELFYGTVMADGLETIKNILKYGMISPGMKILYKMSRMPFFLRRFLIFLLRFRNPHMAKFMGKSYGLGSIKKFWEHQMAVTKFQTEFISRWKALELDVLLCPAPPSAFNLSFEYPVELSSYMCLYNALDFPAGTVPVITVTEEDEAELQQQFCDSQKILQAFAGGVGLPVSVQCVALPWQEEKALRLMKEVETLTREATGLGSRASASEG